MARKPDIERICLSCIHRRWRQANKPDAPGRFMVMVCRKKRILFGMMCHISAGRRISDNGIVIEPCPDRCGDYEKDVMYG